VTSPDIVYNLKSNGRKKSRQMHFSYIMVRSIEEATIDGFCLFGSSRVQVSKILRAAATIVRKW